MSDRILRDLVLRSPVERRRTGDAAVLFYLAAKADARTGGRTLDDLWRAVRPVTGDDATHAAIALGAFGVDDPGTVALVGQCLRRLRQVPGATGTPYARPLIVAVDRLGAAMPPNARSGRGGYLGYALRREYRALVIRGGEARRTRATGDVQPFPTFKVPDGLLDETDALWLGAVAHPATNAAFTAAGLSANTRERTAWFEHWHQAMLRLIAGPEPRVAWRQATRALTAVLLEEHERQKDMAARIDALKLAASYVDFEGLDPRIATAAAEAAKRLTRSVDDWRRRSGRVTSTQIDDASSDRDDGPPPF